MPRYVRMPEDNTVYLLPPEGGTIKKTVHTHPEGDLRTIEYSFGAGAGCKEVIKRTYSDLPNGAARVLIGSAEILPADIFHLHPELVEEYSQNHPIMEVQAPKGLTIGSKKIRKAKSIAAAFGNSKAPIGHALVSDLSLPVGTRVAFEDQAECTGTIAGVHEQIGRYIVVADNRNPGFAYQPEIYGEFQATIVRPVQILRILPPDEHSSWMNVPLSVGVYLNLTNNKEAAAIASALKPGSTGRILRGTPGGVALVAWNVLPPRQEDRRYTHPITKDVYGYVTMVSWDYLGFCTLATNEQVKAAWPGKSPSKSRLLSFKSGDIVVYNSSRAFRINGEQGGLSICQGAILLITATDGRSARVKVLGGCPPAAEGLEAGVMLEHLSPFGFPWIRSGAKVEVTKDVMFKKASLCGKRGRVITPTDTDGDVGVEFPEDMGAGSLDGMGKSGHCLYISSEAIKISA